MSEPTVTITLECDPDNAQEIIRFYTFLNHAKYQHPADWPLSAFEFAKTLHYIRDIYHDELLDDRLSAEFLDQDTGGIVKEWFEEISKEVSDE